MAKHLLSKETYQRLEAEITNLEHNELPRVADLIGKAREMGDLKEMATTTPPKTNMAC